jgi:hypothetical protein
MLFAPGALIAAVFTVMLVGACANEDSSRARSQDARHPAITSTSIEVLD